ncbi:hypothetical protein TcasGA2_TC034911, partial [Tribolium castaneum]
LFYHWGYVSGEDKQPVVECEGEALVAAQAAAKIWWTNDRKARADFILAINPSELNQIRVCITSRDVWVKLDIIYDSKGPARKTTLLNASYNKRCKMATTSDDKNHRDEEYYAREKTNKSGAAMFVKGQASSSKNKFQRGNKSGANGGNGGGSTGDGSGTKKGKRDEKRRNSFLIDKVLDSKSANNLWCLDSGCKSHLCKDEDFFVNVRDDLGQLKLADNSMTRVCGKGDVRIATADNPDNVVMLKDTLYVPNLRSHLLSISKIVDHGHEVTFKKSCAIVLNSFGDSKSDVEERHTRLGHLNLRDLSLLAKGGNVKGLKTKSIVSEIKCDTCFSAKISRAPFGVRETHSSELLELVHTDLCGPTQTQSMRGARYFMTLIDDNSRVCMVYFLQKKSDAVQKFRDYKNFVENQLKRKIKAVQSDGEYENKEMEKLLKEPGIILRTTTPHMPQQNGVAERKNRTLVEVARCMQIDANLPPSLWALAIATANYVRNRCPTKALPDGVSPIELWTRKKPNLLHLRSFGKRVFVRDKTPGSSQAGPNLEAGCSSRTQEVAQGRRRTNNSHLPEPCGFENDEAEDAEQRSQREKQVAKRGPDRPRIIKTSKRGRPSKQYHEAVISEESDAEEQAFTQDQIEEDESADENFDDNNDQIEDNNAFYQTDQCVTMTAIEIPHNNTLKGEDKSEWFDAIYSEAKCLVANDTWKLVDRPANRNIPVARLDSLRFLLALAAKFNLQISQLEITTPYLNGEMDTEMYMEPPILLRELLERIVATERDKTLVTKAQQMLKALKSGDKVCLLVKALYGLRQAGRQLHANVNCTFTTVGLVPMESDPCIYVDHRSGRCTYVLLYVDGIIIVSNNLERVNEIKNHLAEEYQVKDLGRIKYCLGIEVKQEKNKVSICQSGYIREILDKFGMSDCKAVKSPLSVGTKLEASSGVNEAMFPYRELMGALMFLARVSPTREIVKTHANQMQKRLTVGVPEEEVPVKIVSNNKEIDSNKSRHKELNHFINLPLPSSSTACTKRAQGSSNREGNFSSKTTERTDSCSFNSKLANVSPQNRITHLGGDTTETTSLDASLLKPNRKKARPNRQAKKPAPDAFEAAVEKALHEEQIDDRLKKKTMQRGIDTEKRTESDNLADKRKEEFAGLEHVDGMTNFGVNMNDFREVNKNLMDREEVTDFDVPRDPRNTVNLKEQLKDLEDNLTDTNEEIRFDLNVPKDSRTTVNRKEQYNGLEDNVVGTSEERIYTVEEVPSEEKKEVTTRKLTVNSAKVEELLETLNYPRHDTNLWQQKFEDERAFKREQGRAPIARCGPHQELKPDSNTSQPRICNIKISKHNSISLIINERESKALIDTGSDISLVKYSVLTPDQLKTITGNNFILKDVQGAIITNKGQIDLDIHIDYDVVIRHKFIVVENAIRFKGSILIGLDFLHEFKVNICWSEKMVEILGYRIPLETEDQIRMIDLDNHADKRKEKFAGLEHADVMTNVGANMNNFRDVSKNSMNLEVNKDWVDHEEVTDYDVSGDPQNTVNRKEQHNDLEDNLADTDEEILFDFNAPKDPRTTVNRKEQLNGPEDNLVGTSDVK